MNETIKQIKFLPEDKTYDIQANVTKKVTSETGSRVVTFTDGASAPLVKCDVTISAQQDLHGYDKPWVGGAGKNKLALTVTDFKANNVIGTWSGNVYTYLGCKYTLNTDDGGNVISIGVEYSSQSTDVALPFSLKAGSYVLTSGFSEDNGVNDSYLQKNRVTIARGNGASPGNQFTLSEDSTVVWHLRVTNKNYTAYPMIRLSTETDATFTPYSNICPITAYTEGEIEVRGKNIFNPDTVTSEWGNNFLALGGTLSSNVPDGTITLKAGTYTLSNFPNKEIRRFDESGARVQTETGDMTFTLSKTEKVRFAIATENISFNIQLEENTTPTTYEPYTATTHTTTYPSAIYRGSEDVVNCSVETTKIKLSKKWSEGVSVTVLGNYTRKAFILPSDAVSNDPNAICNVAPRILDYVSDELHFYVATETALVFLPNGTDGNTDIEIAYELATPTTSSVTPTNLPIKSLSGYNYIESSTGDMEVEYITQDYQPLVDLIESGNGDSHTYSTTEQVVGKWVDGKDVYEKTYTFTTTRGSVVTIDSDVSFIDTLVSMSGSIANRMGIYEITRGSSGGGNQGFPRIDSGELLYYCGSDSDFIDGDGYLIIRYTKSTPTRSLNLAKSAVVEIPEEIKNAEYEEKPETNEADDDAPTEVDER